MPFYELLAQDDGFPVQGILFLVIAIFSFLKWLYENIVQKGKSQESESNDLEDLYDQYRDEIRQRQSQSHQQPPLIEESSYSPPPLPTQSSQSASPSKKTDSSTPPQGSPQHMQQEIERLRLKKERAAYNVDFPSPNNDFKKNRPVTGLRAELQKKNSLRKAILLREIIGPPKALQD
ncbi:hypothetical protein ACFPK9_01320 [Rubritalea spongiae]|uniref:Uncharacterized protein n=1 Tax=Rubritalea spongiae TaxID=430797 RepID=A0ABW5DZH6_9BACT